MAKPSFAKSCHRKCIGRNAVKPPTIPFGKCGTTKLVTRLSIFGSDHASNGSENLIKAADLPVFDSGTEIAMSPVIRICGVAYGLL